jgi:hypothetical protein
MHEVAGVTFSGKLDVNAAVPTQNTLLDRICMTIPSTLKTFAYPTTRTRFRNGGSETTFNRASDVLDAIHTPIVVS